MGKTNKTMKKQCTECEIEFSFTIGDVKIIKREYENYDYDVKPDRAEKPFLGLGETRYYIKLSRWYDIYEDEEKVVECPVCGEYITLTTLNTKRIKEKVNMVTTTQEYFGEYVEKIGYWGI